MTKENGLKILDLYCHRMGKWTEVPWCPGLFSYNQQLGADQTKTPISPEGQSLLGLICPGYQGQFEHSVQFSSVAQSCPTLCNPMNHSMPGLPVHHQLPDFTQTHVHWVGDAIQPSILCRLLLLLPSIFPSIRVFSNESALCIEWPKYWNFSFNISPSNEYSGPISFRMDWLDLLAVQGTLNSLLQHHSSKASILRCSAFFTVLVSPTLTSIHDHRKNHSLD